ADFGQCCKIGPGGVVTKLPPMYRFALPPEFYKSGVATIHSDIYHMGLLLYRAANGDAEFNAQKPPNDSELERRTIRGKFPDRNRFLPHVPTQMRTVIRKALQIDPAHRYDSATAMSAALASVPVRFDWTGTTIPGLMAWRA